LAFWSRIFGAPARAQRSAVQGGVSVDLFDEEFLRQLQSLSLMNKRSASGLRRAERRSKKKGSGVEFADHRSYVPGDDIRFLDIGVYQRFGKLLLRLFQEEEDLSLYFLVDDSASMGVWNAAKLNQAAQVTAALSYIGLSALDRVSICTLSNQVTGRLPPTRGKERVFRVLTFLSQIRAKGDTDLGTAARAFVVQNKRRGMVILLSDLFDPLGFEGGINVLRFNKFEPVVLHLVDARDETGQLSGDLNITDVETGATREVTMTQGLRERLQSAAKERREKIERFCGSRGVPYFEVNVQVPFDQVVLSVLRKGGLLR
jgi:uncharacterized protein (DUF58 family)